MSNKNLADLIASGAAPAVFILGLNSVALKLSALINTKGFVDDFTEHKTFNGLPVHRSSDLKEDSIVVSCSIAIWPVTVMKRLSSLGLRCVSVLDLIKAKRLEISIPFFDQFRVDHDSHPDFYGSLRRLLSDDRSVRVYDDLLNFRLNHELSAMEEYQVNVKTQYFEDFLPFNEGDVFADVGGYDGATTLEFISRCPEYKSVYVFEPSKINYEKVTKNLTGLRSIYCINKGLSDKEKALRFSEGLGSRSGISANGSDEIRVGKLDDLVAEKITFLKMDIEGSEQEALLGAKKTILSSHPILAISVYHNPEDLRKITSIVLGMRSDYKLYLRHYTEGTDETVMFFVPE